MPTVPTIDELVAEADMLRADIKAQVRRDRMLLQLMAQHADNLQLYRSQTKEVIEQHDEHHQDAG